MKFTYLFIIFLTWSILGLSSCQPNKEAGHHDEHDHEKEEKEASHAPHDDEKDDHQDAILLTRAQSNTLDIQYGDLQQLKINGYIKAFGTLGLPSNAFATVSTRVPGLLQTNKKFVEGEMIKKGEVIGTILNSDIIDLQQKYLETKSNYAYQMLQLKRQQDLQAADAGIEKNLEKAQAELNILAVQKAGLEKSLNYMGIDHKTLTIQNISDRIPVIAPMKGFIKLINMQHGMYIQPNHTMMEIISDDHLHLELNVFEKDIADVKKGLKITYQVPALGSESYDGTVHVIGKEYDSTTKSIRVHGHLDGKKPPFIKDLSVNAKIWTNDQSTEAVNSDAIVTDNSGSFIFIGFDNGTQSSIEFEKINILKGEEQNGFTAIKLLKDLPLGKKIVTKGAYYIYSHSIAEELEHSH